MVMDDDRVSEMDIDNATQNMTNNLYGTTESYEYYKQNSGNFDNNMGPLYLIGRGICKTKDDHHYIDEDNILLHLVMAKFVGSLTRN